MGAEETSGERRKRWCFRQRKKGVGVINLPDIRPTHERCYSGSQGEGSCSTMIIQARGKKKNIGAWGYFLKRELTKRPPKILRSRRQGNDVQLKGEKGGWAKSFRGAEGKKGKINLVTGQQGRGVLGSTRIYPQWQRSRKEKGGGPLPCGRKGEEDWLAHEKRKGYPRTPENWGGGGGI